MVGAAVIVSGRIQTSPVTQVNYLRTCSSTQMGIFHSFDWRGESKVNPSMQTMCQCKPSMVAPVSSSLVIWSPGQPNRVSVGHGCWTAPTKEARFPTSLPQWKRHGRKILLQTGPEAQRPHGAPVKHTIKYINNRVIDRSVARTLLQTQQTL